MESPEEKRKKKAHGDSIRWRHGTPHKRGRVVKRWTIIFFRNLMTQPANLSQNLSQEIHFSAGERRTDPGPAGDFHSTTTQPTPFAATLRKESFRLCDQRSAAREGGGVS